MAGYDLSLLLLQSFQEVKSWAQGGGGEATGQLRLDSQDWPGAKVRTVSRD